MPVPVEEELEADEVAELAAELAVVLVEVLAALEELEVVKVAKVVLLAIGDEVEDATDEEGSANEGAPLAQTRVPFLMPSRTSASEMMLPLSEYMTTVGPATMTSMFSVVVAASRFTSWWCW